MIWNLDFLDIHIFLNINILIVLRELTYGLVIFNFIVTLFNICFFLFNFLNLY